MEIWLVAWGAAVSTLPWRLLIVLAKPGFSSPIWGLALPKAGPTQIGQPDPRTGAPVKASNARPRHDSPACPVYMSNSIAGLRINRGVWCAPGICCLRFWVCSPCWPGARRWRSVKTNTCSPKTRSSTPPPPTNRTSPSSGAPPRATTSIRSAWACPPRRRASRSANRCTRRARSTRTSTSASRRSFATHSR